MTLEEYMKQNKKQNNTDKKNNYRNSIIRRTLLTATLVLIMLIICNLSTKAKKVLNKYIFETNYNFAKINNIYKKYFLDLTNKTKENILPTNKTSVLEYYSAKDSLNGVELTVDKDYNVKLLESGLVVFVGQKEPYGSVVVIQQSNGIDVIYGGITSKDIKVYDYIEKGTIIGTCDEKLYLEFQKEGESLDYKPYIK